MREKRYGSSLLKRLMSLALSLVMLLSMMPVAPYAQAAEVTEPEVVVTETEPAATVAETEAEETVAETEPEETVLETEPEETVIETEPEETVVETEPEETIVETEPEETVVETEPVETVIETEPEETVVETEPEVVVVETEANASVVYTELEAGDSVTETLESESAITYVFEAPATEDYLLWNEGDGIRCAVTVEESGDEIADTTLSGSNTLLFSAEEGVRYLIEIQNNYTKDKTYILRLDAIVEPETIDLNDFGISGFIGYSGSVRYTYGPVNAAEDDSYIEWEYDSDVVELETEMFGYVAVHMVGEGTTTITATLPNGESDSVDVTVQTPEELTCDEPVALDIGYGEQGGLSFIAPADGEYFFRNTADGEVEISLYHVGEGYVGWGTSCMAALEEGEEYLVIVNNYSGGQPVIEAAEAVEATGISLGKKNYTGYLWDYLRIPYTFVPANAMEEEITWTSSDEDIVVLQEAYSEEAVFQLVGVGKAVITAETESGLSAECTVTVSEGEEIELGFEQDVTMADGEILGYIFTAPESGEYVFWNDNGEWLYIEVLDSNGEYVASSGRKCIFEVEADETYYIHVSNNNDAATEGILRLDELVEAEQLILTAEGIARLELMPGDEELEEDSGFAFVGESVFLRAEIFPANTPWESVTWTLEGEGAEFDHEGSSSSNYLNLLAEGTVTVTATSDSGLSDSCTITILEPEAIEVGFCEDVEIAANDVAAFVFVPEETGSYGFWDDSDYGAYMEVSKDGLGFDGKDGQIQFYGEAGSTYIIRVYNQSETEQTLQLNLEASVPLTGVYLNTDSVSLEVGQTTTLRMYFEPANSYYENVSWKIADTAIAEIAYIFEDVAAITAKSAGTTTVTVTVDGYTATCTITTEGGDPEEPEEEEPEEPEEPVEIPVDAPVITKITNDTETGKPKLTWDAVENAVKYKVYRSTSKTGTYALMKTVTDTVYINQNAKTGVTYYYYVTAVSETDTESEKSNIVQRICDLGRPVITVTNADSTGKLKISWAEVPDAVAYQIWRCATQSGTYTKIATVEATSYTDTDMEIGETYYYKVKAVADNTRANSVYSVVASGICKLARPVVTLSSVTSTGKIKLSWKKIADAKGYEVYRATSKTGTYTRLKKVTGVSTTDTTAVAGQTYYYKVKAIAADPDANSAFSAVKSRTCDLAQPTLTLSNDAESGKIKVSWTAVEGAKEYEVYRADSKDGTYSLINTTSATSYVNRSVTAGKTYYYKVRAVMDKTAANSAYTEVKSRTCDLARPVVTLSNVSSSGKVKLSWKAIEGAVEYKVYWSTTKDGTYKLVKTTDGTSYTHTGAKAGATNYYKVKAIAKNTAANSAYSLVKSRICDLARPVVTISNVASTGRIKLSWKKIEGAVRYDIYRSETKTGGYELQGSATGITWIDGDAEASEAYYYKVIAIAENASANSAYSAVKSRTCDLARPVVSVAANTKGKPKLSWAKVSGAISYKVYRATSKTGTYTLLKTTTAVTYTDTNAASGKTYYYKVMAVSTNAEANSAYSAVDSFTVK